MLKALRRAFSEFLAIPSLVVASCVGLAIGMLVLDSLRLVWTSDLRAWMSAFVFNDASATSNLLGTIAGGLLTVTGIVFALLLLALAQSAGTLTQVVFDQYLRRKANQIYLGFFNGVALYSLVVLAATHDGFNPVLSATVALLLAILALLMLVFIIYNTVDEMRPAQIVDAILQHILAARRRQLELFARMRSSSSSSSPGLGVRSTSNGYVSRVDVDRCAAALVPHAGAEIVLRVSIGTYVAHGDVLAELHGVSGEEFAAEVRCAIELAPVRDLAADASYGIQELVSIGWKSISTSAQSPTPGASVIYALRDLLGRWGTGAETPSAPRPIVAMVYKDDVLVTLWDAIDSIGVVCSESMQTQNAAELVNALALVFDRLELQHQDRAADAAMRILSGLGDHVPTAALDRALERLAEALRTTHSHQADAVEAARTSLARSTGRLNSRATRVPGGAT